MVEHRAKWCMAVLDARKAARKQTTLNLRIFRPSLNSLRHMSYKQMRHSILPAPLRWLERVERDVNGFSGQLGQCTSRWHQKEAPRSLRGVATNLCDTSFNLLTTI